MTQLRNAAEDAAYGRKLLKLVLKYVEEQDKELAREIKEFVYEHN